ncbi:putative colanic acid biosynthesis acetyltransferase [Cohnella lupini]|uniref:Putative colanic acid biosynthesis acetyltransferase WcaF n=1 Tax=Cohnella lupini TaxID=1294267 RepID=A0A3D9ITD2_9BACL|nr:putative colanic acid biosynthesis acetyltransferase [Cohnella lupini]RED65053.1 putative colanic acid biosynthesis acetyltransferase WcaF [Cohnella lupini]
MKNRVRLDLYVQEGYSRGRSGLIVLLWWLVQSTAFRWSLQPMYAWRNWLLKLFGAEIGIGVKVRPTATITYPWKVKIGEHSWIGDHAELYSLDSITIGNHCVVSQNGYLCTGSHDASDPQFSLIVNPIRIEDGAWLASDVFVYPGVTVGVMAVVAARSTVLRDVPTNEVHAGTPAKYIKHRFETMEEEVPQRTKLHLLKR